MSILLWTGKFRHASYSAGQVFFSSHGGPFSRMARPRTKMEQPDIRWLHSAAGNAIAFIRGREVFLPDGTLLGRLEGHEVWNSHYVGELYAGERLVRKLYRPLGMREEHEEERTAPPLPELPPPLPCIILPSDLHELEIKDALEPDFFTRMRKTGKGYAF